MALYTPYPVGAMPLNIRMFEDGARIELALETIPTHDGVVFDQNSGEYFQVTLNRPCGLGCRCAAEASWWPPREDSEPAVVEFAIQVHCAIRVVNGRITRVTLSPDGDVGLVEGEATGADWDAAQALALSKWDPSVNLPNDVYWEA
jgi:hypothetical protein